MKLSILAAAAVVVTLVAAPRVAEACSPAAEVCTLKIPFDGQVVPIGVTAMPFIGCNATVDPTMASLTSSDGMKTFTVGYDGKGLTFGTALPAGSYSITVPPPQNPQGGTAATTKGTFTVQNAPPQPSRAGTLTATVSDLPAQAGSTEGCGTAELPKGQRVDVALAPDASIAPWSLLISEYTQHLIYPDGSDHKRTAPLPERLSFDNRCLGDNNQLATGHYKMTVAPVFEGASFSPEVATAEFDLACDTVPGQNPEGKPLPAKATDGCSTGGTPASAIDIALLAFGAILIRMRANYMRSRTRA